MKSLKLFFILVCLLPVQLLAAIETASNRIEGPQITTSGGPHLSVFDNKYLTMASNSSWSTQFSNYKITNKIRLGINPEVLQTDNLSGSVTITIKYWKWVGGAFQVSTESKTLSVDYNTTPSNVINDLSTYVTSDALRMQITITNISAGMDVNDLFLEAQIETERYYPFSGNSPLGQSITTAGSNLHVEWTPMVGAEYYELEWVHVNKYKADGGFFTASDLSANFYRNSTRLILRTPYYNIPNVFDKGFVVFRVRAIGLMGSTFTQRQEGTWNISEGINLSSLTQGTHYLEITSEFDPDMNWGYQVAYAEDGKRFEGISYADGLGMVRQSVGYNPVNGQSVVSNVYYDGYGRPAVSDLPTPDVNASPFVHRPNFNTAVGASFFGPEHFDQTDIPEDGDCVFQTTPFSYNSGAGKYYSTSNPDKAEENKRIPDAEGFPFARVEYTDDHTGRIRRAGGVGLDFQVGSGHETEFFYGTPSQEELDRLFGSEVGYAPHYQRRITVDANGQAYVEYFDMAGRVIASGLIGDAPDNLDELLTNQTFNLTQTITDGVNGEVTPTSMILTTPLTIHSGTNYTISYDLNPVEFTDETCAPTVCMDCMYDLSVVVKDEDCGTVLFSSTHTINGGEYDALCNTDNPFGWDTTLFIPQNNYVLIKTLTINQHAINGYWCTYLENNTCVPTFTELFNEAYANADFDSCDDEVLFEEDEYSCSAMEAVMLNDMSPGGQYAQYAISGSTYSAANTISVLYTGGSPALSGDWKNPSGTGYKDELGNQAYVEVTLISSTPSYVYSPALTGSVNPSSLTLLSNGNYLAKPEQLDNLADFVNLFQDSWAEALLPYHPEYCYLQYCMSAENDSSHTYDAGMNAITTFDDACAGGYFAPLGYIDVTYGENAYVNGLFSGCNLTNQKDPFFMPASDPDYADMDDKLRNYGGTGFSMWEYAVALVMCDGSTNLLSCYRDIKDIGCNEDQIWLTFRDLYLAAKAELYAQAEEDYIDAQGCNTVTETIGVSGVFIDAVPRWGFFESMTNQYSSTTAIQDELDDMEAQACATVCAAYADEWLAQLANCQNLPTGQDLTDLRNDLIALCSAGCTAEHPSGATTLPPSVSINLHDSYTLTGGSSINDVLAHDITGFTENDLCSELLISEPGPYQADLLEDQYMDDCGCELMLQTKYEFDLLEGNNELPVGVTTIEQYLAYTTGISMEDADALICACEETALADEDEWTPSGYVWTTTERDAILGWQEIVDPLLTCDACVSCEDVQSGIAALETRFGSGIDESPNYELLLTNFLNEQFEFDLTYAHYQQFMLQCSATSENPYCTPTDEILNWRDVMNLLAHRGQLVGGSSGSPQAILSNNIVYKTGSLYDLLLADGYYATVSGNTLTQQFVKDESAVSCSTSLTLPAGATYTFADIVAFGAIMPDNTGCDPVANTFTVEVRYYSCGELTLDTISGSTDCFPIQTCYCGGDLSLCNESVQEQFNTEAPCYEPTLSQLYQEVQEQYDEAIAAAKVAFAESYNTACADAFATEHMEYTGPFNQYQYTLFYYDQAGNLVKTIAPKGTTPLSSTTAAAQSRDNTTSIDDQDPAVLPGHTFATKYTYNSYDQLVNTENPDQLGSTQYWYDRYGRIVASQNPAQAAQDVLAYVLYDKQGRPVETGITTSIAISETTLKADDLGASFKTWVYAGSRMEVTYTVYDKTMSATVSGKFATGSQQNLRLRVASVVYFESVSASIMPTTGYVSATHYSYDLHGNVLEVLQDVPQLAPVEQDIKSTQYEFELLSGNVKKVHYQKGRRTGGYFVEDQRDRITHEYVYDALNRLTEVFTSTDKGTHKSREAHYRYFDYGPMARVEIGEYKVQGNDYSYTIHGWLKSMNSSVLNSTRDAGLDGSVDDHPNYPSPNPEQNALTARDMLGYTLGYFDGDYQAIGTNNYVAGISSGNLYTGMKQLYNGNIAYTTIAIDGFADQATAYHYDQLQRLTQAQVYRSASNLVLNNNWNDAATTTEYYNEYAYDANGNLEHLRRDGAGVTQAMDDFTYKYAQDANRLVYVDDAIAAGNYSMDIDDQSGTANQPIYIQSSNNNYKYDDLGQLTIDVQENLQLQWRLGDKKLKLQTETNVQQIEFVYNPMGQRVLKIVKDYVSGSYNESAINSWRYTYYAYDANGQVMATYDLINNTVTNVKTATLDEQMLYGMSRLGVKSNSTTIYTNQQSLAPESSTWQNQVGKKNYELTNHLGNVNVVITDRKVVNTNYVVNTFTNSTNSWGACGNASLATGATAMTVTSTGPSNNCTYKVFTTTANTPYVVRIKSAKGTVSAGLRVSIWGGATLLKQVALANGDFSHVVFTANGANATIIIEPISGNGVYTIDEVSLTPNSIYEAVPVMKADYYPFGMEMPGRVTNAGAYRYAYNGMEVDPETKGNGNSYTTEFRQYDPRLGRWLSLDPMMAKYPQMSPYCAFNNNPVFYVDPLGLEGGPAKEKIDFEGGNGWTKQEAKTYNKYLKHQGIDGKVGKNTDGSFSVYDKKQHTVYEKATIYETVFQRESVDIFGGTSAIYITPEERKNLSGKQIIDIIINYGSNNKDLESKIVTILENVADKSGAVLDKSVIDNKGKIHLPTLKGFTYKGGKTRVVVPLKTEAKQLKIFGKYMWIIGLYYDVVEVAEGYKEDGYTIGRETVKETAGAVGSWGGGLAGAAIGFESGASVAGPWGALGGTILGGIIGSFVGEEVMESWFGVDENCFGCIPANAHTGYPGDPYAPATD